MNTTDHAQDGSADEVAGIVLDQFERLLAQHLSPRVLAACDGAVDGAAWPADLWRALADSGLPLALVPEAADGIGLEASTAARLIRRCGQAALPLPLPETIVGAALWAAAGGGALDGALTLVPAGSPVRITQRADGFVLDGRTAQVPWGGSVAVLLVDAIDAAGARHLVRIRAPGTVRDTRHNLAGEPRDALDLTGCAVAAADVRTVPDWIVAGGVGSVAAAGAFARAQQMVGAMETCLASALDHVRERQQFGRPLAKFQAIQHMLAEAAGHVAAATAVGRSRRRVLGRPALRPRHRDRQGALRRGGGPRRGDLPPDSMGRWASPRSTRCTARRGACGPGGTSSAPMPCGRNGSGARSAPAAARPCGRCWCGCAAGAG